MSSEENRIKNRLAELSAQSRQKNCFVFTDFLSPLESSLALESHESRSLSFNGGYEAAERKIARFGDPQELGYEEDFPIKILKVSPINERFTESLSHRDFLGAILNLGIERSVIGDILVKDRKSAYFFAAERMAEFIVESLNRVRHTQVYCEEVAVLPEEARPVLEERSVVVAQSRLDGVLSKLFNISRSEAKAAFTRQEVFRNGRVCTNSSVLLNENDIISVRHKGKFIYKGMQRSTKKGNEVVSVEIYV